MSYVVSTGTDTLCRDKDRPCGVEVTVCGEPAGHAFLPTAEAGGFHERKSDE